jgi:hypothetical protein
MDKYSTTSFEVLMTIRITEFLQISKLFAVPEFCKQGLSALPKRQLYPEGGESSSGETDRRLS